jgi:hypothetical protein
LGGGRKGVLGGRKGDFGREILGGGFGEGYLVREGIGEGGIFGQRFGRAIWDGRGIWGGGVREDRENLGWDEVLFLWLLHVPRGC